MNIYLDINGVVLHHRQPAPHVEALLQYVTAHHQAWWLSTAGITAEDILPYLAPVLPPAAMAYAEKVQPRPWQRYKTDGIDFTQPFRWLDDNPTGHDLAVLARHHALDSLIQINLDRHPHQLRDILAQL